MFRIETGSTRKYCDGISRRSFVQLGVAGLANVALADVLRARQTSADLGLPRKDTSVILLWLDGGPSHLDLYDMKPRAPAEYRGIWRPIRTNVTGVEISELFPLQAKVADKFSLIRSLHHNTGDHFTAGHYMLTGRGGVNGLDTAGKYPSIGSMVTRQCGARRPNVPAYVSVPYASSIGLRPGYFGANYLGPQHNPFEVGGDPNKEAFSVQNVKLPSGMTVRRMEDRRGLLSELDGIRRSVDASGALNALDRFQQEAYEMVTGPAARKAFDIASEEPAVRDRYGRHTWGQSTLLARRLVEAGCAFVTVHFGGWDHHWNLESGMNSHLPRVDSAVSALLTDLEERGLRERILVMVCGEFSRTPRMNNGHNGKGTPGRDHWGNAMFCLMGGGGVQGGRVVGSTDARGEAPHDRPVAPGDIHATLFHVMGVDPQVSFRDHTGRPIRAIDHGDVINELI